jgi:biopolymer transport protein ExbD
VRRMHHQDVELQVTPMLDMAFQLLTFFILTYRPAPVEGQFSMNLLPAAAAVEMGREAPPSDAQANAEVPAALRTLTTRVEARPDGSIGRITIGENEDSSVEQLRERLKTITADKTLPFDQAVIEADPGLRYEELMKVIDAFASNDITSISFTEMVPGGGPAL